MTGSHTVDEDVLDAYRYATNSVVREGERFTDYMRDIKNQQEARSTLDDAGTLFECSECESRAFVYGDVDDHECRVCGADMQVVP